jgi:uncharacterized membrane protein HdeD (DUF308 family)
MNAIKRPVSVLILACLYIAVGVLGLVAHYHDFSQPDGIWIALTEVVAILAGVFLFRGHNWARWLALAWMAFHIAISFPVLRQIAVHTLFFAVIAWLLFRPAARAYFRSA